MGNKMVGILASGPALLSGLLRSLVSGYCYYSFLPGLGGQTLLSVYTSVCVEHLLSTT